jgi:hypothetical protein
VLHPSLKAVNALLGRTGNAYDLRMGPGSNICRITDCAEILTAVVMVITPCNPSKVNRRFGGAPRLRFQSLRVR